MLLALITAAVSTAAAQRIDTLAIERALRQEMTTLRVPGAAIAVILDGRVAYSRAFGVRSIETQDSMTVRSLVRIGSITKTFTGLTAASLAAQRRIDLDAPIGTVASNLSPALRSLTLRQLLSHTAGLIDEGAGVGSHDADALERRIRGWDSEHVLGPAGDIYAYSSPGYWLAGYVLARAMKTAYTDIVREVLLTPVGMQSATFEPLVAMTYPLALDHRRSGDRISVLRPYPDDASTWPSGSLFASVHDLGRFAAALSNHGILDGQQVLPAEVVRSAMKPIARIAGPDSLTCGYGLGVSTCTRNGLRLVSHYGFRAGSGAVLTVAPDSGFAVVILANMSGAIMRRTERAVLDAVFGARRDERPEAKPRAMTRGIATRWAGSYVMGRDTLRLIARGDSLSYKYAANAPQPSVEDGDGALLVLDAQGGIEQRFFLVRGKSGAVYLHDGLNAFRRVPDVSAPRRR